MEFNGIKMKYDPTKTITEDELLNAIRKEFNNI